MLFWTQDTAEDSTSAVGFVIAALSFSSRSSWTRVLALLFARRCFPRACCEGSVQLRADSSRQGSRVICALVWQRARALGPNVFPQLNAACAKPRQNACSVNPTNTNYNNTGKLKHRHVSDLGVFVENVVPTVCSCTDSLPPQPQLLGCWCWRQTPALVCTRCRLLEIGLIKQGPRVETQWESGSLTQASCATSSAAVNLCLGKRSRRRGGRRASSVGRKDLKCNLHTFLTPFFTYRYVCCCRAFNFSSPSAQFSLFCECRLVKTYSRVRVTPKFLWLLCDISITLWTNAARCDALASFVKESWICCSSILLYSLWRATDEKEREVGLLILFMKWFQAVLVVLPS